MIPNNVIEYLIHLYSRPDRYYHNVNHIANCFKELSKVTEIDNRFALEIAIWFHDAMYNSQCNINEELSAELVKEKLGISSALITNLIMDTKHNEEPKTNDGKVIADIDLSILGQSREMFDEYERCIRLEYSWVLGDDFSIKRLSVIRKFLERPNIYWTEYFRNRYEDKARENLQHSFSKWQLPGGFYVETIDKEMLEFIKSI